LQQLVLSDLLLNYSGMRKIAKRYLLPHEMAHGGPRAENKSTAYYMELG
jgi:hypothetical protein